MLLAGDLLNQIISAGFAARNLGIPFYGLYGACSTMSESLSVGGMLADGGFADRLIWRDVQPLLHGGAAVSRAAGIGQSAHANGAVDGDRRGRGNDFRFEARAGGLDAYDMRARGGSGHYGCEQHGRSHDASGLSIHLRRISGI